MKTRKTRAELWRDAEGLLDEVQTIGSVTQVVRRDGYVRPNFVACRLNDTGNGFIARFPASSSVEQDAFVCLDYDQARSLVLALSHHSQGLGFYERKT